MTGLPVVTQGHFARNKGENRVPLASTYGSTSEGVKQLLSNPAL